LLAARSSNSAADSDCSSAACVPRHFPESVRKTGSQILAPAHFASKSADLAKKNVAPHFPPDALSGSLVADSDSAIHCSCG
jgi:hypothetical protein